MNAVSRPSTVTPPAPGKRWPPVSWFRAQKVYILPTRAVITLALVLAAMWYAAVSQNNAMAYLLLFFLGSLTVLSMNYTHFNLVGLRVDFGKIEPVFAGADAELPVEITNPSRRERHSLELVSPEREPYFIGSLPGRGAKVSARLLVPTTVRGEHALPRITLRSIFPLGLFEGRQYRVTAGKPLLVYPAPHGNLPLPRGESQSRLELAAVGPGGEDYAGSRPYRVGESQRHVDWRAVARGQPLLLKQFVGTGGERIWLEWNELGALPDVESRLSQLSRWIVEAERGVYQYGLRMPGFEAAPARGDRHQHQLLRALALFDAHGAPVVDPPTATPA